jgi:hypothetical protein
VSKNQHRWQESLDRKICSVLGDAAERLEWAWDLDMKYPKSYPVNTDIAFYEIKGWIEECRQEGQADGQPQVESKGIKLIRRSPPRSFSELVGENAIRIAYEGQNVNTYRDALRIAASGDRLAGFTFRKILNAVRAAYSIERYGPDAAPKPKVHFLHRRLLEIAESLDLNDLTHEGIVEFLDDLCPCGKIHKQDAVRKLRMRTASNRAKA